ncbi:tumor necrosis factor ligand superfamily member 18 [Halichoeres trimaculatus]|uniref:tumor necrosis factor ligand superfamily member 18 n=1 Tax=Halichoeres trimaculatus TaxID=147232 RepID=UPI003D9E5284
MPQSAQHSLVQVLLLWITILSITQVVFITLFFTQNKSQNCSAVDPGHARLSTTNNKPVSGTPLLGRMLTFRGSPGNRKIRWDPKLSSTELLSVHETKLKVQQDGSYFINLQVNLDPKKCKTAPPSENIEVCLNLTGVPNKKEPDILLQGWITKETCSTGLLAKVVSLTEGDLEVTINSTTSDITDNEALTHLDIIYMSK